MLSLYIMCTIRVGALNCLGYHQKAYMLIFTAGKNMFFIFLSVVPLLVSGFLRKERSGEQSLVSTVQCESRQCEQQTGFCICAGLFAVQAALAEQRS